MNQAAKLSNAVDRPGKGPRKTEKGKKTKAKGDQVTRGRLKAQLHPHLKEYFESLADPWRITGVRCPVNYNPVPSFVTQYARTTAVVSQTNVPASQSQTLVLWPGHGDLFTPGVLQGSAAGSNVGLADMDEVAYHALNKSIGGTIYSVGPIPFADGTSTVRQPTIGCLLSSAGTAGNVGGPLTGASVALTYGQELPYQGNSTLVGHARWKLVSMGVIVKNTTPEISRGGAIISFQPINNTGDLNLAAPIGSYMYLPTWKDHGSDSMKITWIPRMRDLAYWHGTNAVGTSGAAQYSSTPGVPGIVVSLQTPAVAQTYDIEVVCNWELAGNLFLPIGSPGHHMPEAKSIVERVHTQLINKESTASRAVSYAQSAVASVSETLGTLHKVAGVVGAGLKAAGFTD